MPAIFLEGILYGLVLAAMLGPIFVALTQTAIEKGAKAGLTVGLGIWISDLLIIVFSYLFIRQVDNIIQDAVFKYWIGLIGGFIFITFGIAMCLKKAEEIETNNAFTAKNYLGFWLKGFLVNTINPFTFIFWLSCISNKVIGVEMNDNEAAIFLSAIMITIVCTDSPKVLGAKAIRSKLQPKHVQMISRVAGAALLVFGLVLLYQTGDNNAFSF